MILVHFQVPSMIKFGTGYAQSPMARVFLFNDFLTLYWHNSR